MAKTTRTITDAVRDTCLSLPGASESFSHGSPVFRINDRQFATYSVNHHGDGRVAKDESLPSPAATQAPNAPVPMEEFDALQTKRGKAALAVVRPLCLALPEVVEDSQWGNPAWKAGKKTFCTANAWNGKIALQFWVGKDHQVGLTADPRFSIPAYTGHNGWIELRANDGVTEAEIAPLLEMSYRHFALKRMLKALDA